MTPEEIDLLIECIDGDMDDLRADMARLSRERAELIYAQFIEGVDADMDDHRSAMARLSRERAELIYAQREAKAESAPRLRGAGGVG